MKETMLSAGGGAVVKQLACQFGLDADQAAWSVSALLPALAEGLQKKLSGSDGFGISNLITSGKFSGFVENPSSLAGPAVLEPGKTLVSKIFGSGDLTKLASTAAKKTGVSGTIISGMLPLMDTLLGCVLAKSAAAGDNLTDVVGQIASKGSGGLLSGLKKRDPEDDRVRAAQSSDHARAPSGPLWSFAA